MFIKPRLEQALGDLAIAYFRNIPLLPEAVRAAKYDAGVEILKQLEEHEQTSTYGFMLWVKIGVLAQSKDERSETFRVRGERVYPLLGNIRLQSYAADAPIDLLFDRDQHCAGEPSRGRTGSVLVRQANTSDWTKLSERPVISFKKKMMPTESVMLVGEVLEGDTTFLISLQRRHDLAFKYSFLNGSAAADFRRYPARSGSEK